MKILRRGTTRKYDRFVVMDSNRVYRESHAKALAKDISEHNMLAAQPIIVTKNGHGKLRVLDGQHRLAAARRLKIDLPYIVVAGVSEEDIARLNRNQKGWGTKDYLHHYCALGYSEYIKLQEYIDRTGLPVTLAVNIMAGAVYEGGAKACNAKFKEGGFVVADAEFAEEVAGAINAMKGKCPFVTDRSCVRALELILRHVPEFSVSRLLARMDYMPFEKRASWDMYVTQIERMYNYRSPAGSRLHIASRLADAGVWRDHT